jgi:hypothetical protein
MSQTNQKASDQQASDVQVTPAAPPIPPEGPLGPWRTAPVICPICGRRGRRHEDQLGLPYCNHCGMFKVDPIAELPI